MVLIDDVGELWPGDSTFLRRAFVPGKPEEGVSAYLIQTLGFVAIDPYFDSALVRIRPARVSKATFETLRRWLRVIRYDAIVLAVFDDDWAFEVCDSARRASARIAALIDEQHTSSRPPFLSVRRELSSAEDNALLRSVLEAWRAHPDPDDHEHLIATVKNLVRRRYAVVERNVTTGVLEYADVGSGYRTHGREWSQRATGRPIVSHLEDGFGDWVASQYEDTLQTIEPRTEHIDAIVETPRFGRYRIRLQRLTLPLRTTQSTRLLSCGILNPGIDLRVADN